jgi:hypothetical protein
VPAAVSGPFDKLRANGLNMLGAHLIEDLCFDVGFDSEPQAFDGQARLAAFAQGPALRIIDQLFDAAQADGEVLRMERLELDLGTVAQDDMEDQWSRRLRERLQLALDEQRAALEWGTPAPYGSGVTRRTRRQARREALLFFLRHGRLPWHAGRGRDGEAIVPWAREVLRDGGAEFAAALRALGDRASLARRLVRQFPLDWLQALMHELLPQASGRVVPLLAAPRTQREEDALVATLCEVLAETGAGTVAQRPGRIARDGESAVGVPASLARLRAQWDAALVTASAPSPTRDPPADIARTWSQLVREDGAWLRASLLRQGRSRHARNALAAGLAQPMLVELIGLWWTHAQRQAAADVVRRAAQRLDTAGDASRVELHRRMLWEATLAYLLVGGGAERFSEDDCTDSVLRVLNRTAQHGPRTPEPTRERAGRPPHLAMLRVRLAAALTGSSSEGVEAAWQALLQQDPAGLRNTLRETCAAPAVRRRMARQFSEAMWLQCASLWLPQGEAQELAAVVKAVSLATRPVPSPDAKAAPADARPLVAEGDAWGMALAAMLRQRDAWADTGSCVRELVQQAAMQAPQGDAEPAPASAVHPLRRAVEVALDMPRAVQRLLDRLLPDHVARVLRWLRPLAASTPPERRGASLPVAAPARAPAPAAPSAQAAPSFDAAGDDPAQVVFIANAGLVLAGPYLPRLLAMLGLTDGRGFKDGAAAQRAVLLLQFVATGALDVPEPLLVLNKLMCGLPIEQPVPRELDLTEAERRAVDGMLMAMIEHWKILGRTSITGLRESFLQREGRLERQDEAWQLKVEPRSFDMLIDQLPWGYATLKMPWMERVIHVDWR